MTAPHPLRILLVEDNQGDIMLIREALSDTAMAVELSLVRNGQDAIDFLRREGLHEKAARPDIVVLDQNLPLKNGREVLAEMRVDPSLNQIPVVVMTGSRGEPDICSLYTEGRCRYLVKPSGYLELVSLLNEIEQFAASFQRPGER